MSKPRPIHNLHREIRNQPDPAEPSFSYERKAYLEADREEHIADDFHRKLAVAFPSGRASTTTSLSNNNNRTTVSNNNSNNNSQHPTRQFRHPSPTQHVPRQQQQQQQQQYSGGEGGSPFSTKDSKTKDIKKKNKDIDKQRAAERRLKAMELETNNPNGIDNESLDDNDGEVADAVTNRSPTGPPTSSITIPNMINTQRQPPILPFQPSLLSSSTSVDVSDKSLSFSSTTGTNNYSSTMYSGYNGPSTLPSFPGPPSASMDRSSSDVSTGSFLYCKTPHSTGLFGKSASLIFPTGVDSSSNTKHRSSVHSVEDDHTEEVSKMKRAKIDLALDHCENIRFPFKKKLVLRNLKMNASDIPLKALRGTPMGNTLFKLDLSGNNRLGTIPPELVQCLPSLKILDLSQCQLNSLPMKWHLPKLTKLDLSSNKFTDFPEESMLEGLPDLQELNMYGNIVKVITIPTNTKLLSKLEILDLGYNDVVFLPDELDRIKSLRVLKVPHNYVTKISMKICEMDLKTIDVSSNPITEPPIETCERGICSMRRYWQCIRMEEQTKTKAVTHQKKLLESMQQHHSNHASQQQPILMSQQRGSGIKFGLFQKKSAKSNSSISSSSHTPTSSVGRKTSVTSQGSNGSGEGSTHNHKISSSSNSGNMAPIGPTVSSSVATAPIVNTSLQQTQQQMRQVSVSSASTTYSYPLLSPASDARKAVIVGPDSELYQNGDASADTLRRPLVSSPDSHEPADSVVDGSLISMDETPNDQITVNDTLKVIFVGMAMVGKTSMIKRLIEGEKAVIPTADQRTVGVDIYAWEPQLDRRFEHIKSTIEFQDKELAALCGDVEVKFSVWDFAGQHVYHATHELFFSSRSLYVLVWDMGANNVETRRRKTPGSAETGSFKQSYDSSEEEDEDEVDLDVAMAIDREARRADRALESDIDDKVQFWVDCIQSSAPGAAILPVASYNDYFDHLGGESEAIRRCNMLKQRLLKHEERRIQGIEERLREYRDQNRPNDQAAKRLRTLLCPFTRPKLIFGEDGPDSVVRVSGSKYTGFGNLTEKIIGIATGRNKGQSKYPIFHGHVGARIPRMRLDVRNEVKKMRDKELKLPVVEWGYFVNRLRDKGSVEDISDALHFLTNTGEVSYFGSVMQGAAKKTDSPINLATNKESDDVSCTAMKPVDGGEKVSLELSDDDDDDDDRAHLSMDDTSITAQSTLDGSLTTVDDLMSAGLSQFVFLNPKWLVAAVACILRHDLDREIKETRRIAASGGDRTLSRTASFFDAHLNCPVITASDALLLWDANRITKRAAEKAEKFSDGMTITPFEFLQRLLIRFGVFVPIDLSIEKASFGGKDYQLVDDVVDDRHETLDTPAEIVLHSTPDKESSNAEHFFLPSLLGPWEPADAWTYKNVDSWKTTLCHSVLFPDGVPPGLMERLTASVLSSIYAVANRKDMLTSDQLSRREAATCEGILYVKEVLCWRTAFYLKVGTKVHQSGGPITESIVEIFTHLANRESSLCVGSDHMEVGARRLIVSGRGQVGDGGRKIWKGGYLLVIKCINRVMAAYGGLEYENQGFCPECLAKVPVANASSWEMTKIRGAVLNGEPTLRCRLHGHPIDTRLVAGPIDIAHPQKRRSSEYAHATEPSDAHPANVAVRDLQRAVVVVGLWDGKERKITKVGSGFIVDKKRGLIVTAAHTLVNIDGDPNYPYGENYFGLPQGKVVIGVIPEVEDSSGAVFRYFAKIVAKCSYLERNACKVDACVLRITTRMETDVAGDGSGCGDVPEMLLLNNPRALKSERLQTLKMTEKCELDEQVRILGYNQGGEGVVNPGENLNRFIDLSRGYVSKKFMHGEIKRERFQPGEEIAISDCRTIGGHSGGPCVNQQGEVIGILCRADSADNKLCYLVPSSELKVLVNQAKKQL